MWTPEKVDNIIPIVQEPLKPEDVIKPIDVLQIEPEDLKNLTSAPVVKEAIDDLYSTTTVLSTTTPLLVETTPAEIEPSLKPVVIILPANVTIDEIKTAIDLLPDTNNTVTVIAGQTPLIENENILDHPEELITQDDIEHIEPISNPVDLVKAIQSTLPQGRV